MGKICLLIVFYTICYYQFDILLVTNNIVFCGFDTWKKLKLLLNNSGKKTFNRIIIILPCLVMFSCVVKFQKLIFESFLREHF